MSAWEAIICSQARAIEGPTVLARERLPWPEKEDKGVG